MSDLNGKRILDVWCGFGKKFILLAKCGALMTGIDISAKNIDVAKRNASAQGMVNIKFMVLKAEDLDCEEKFDVIFCRGSLHHFYDVKSVVNHLYGWVP